MILLNKILASRGYEFYEGVAANDLVEYADETFRLISVGSSRRVYELPDEAVLKIETGIVRQSETEYIMTESFPSQIRTEIYSSRPMAASGIIIAEAVIPFYSFVTSLVDDCGDYDYSNFFTDLEYYNASDASSGVLADYGILPEWLIQTLHEFELVVEAYGIYDMHADNLGFREDGTLVALDLGYGSSDIGNEDGGSHYE